MQQERGATSQSTRWEPGGQQIPHASCGAVSSGSRRSRGRDWHRKAPRASSGSRRTQVPEKCGNKKSIEKDLRKKVVVPRGA
jgi:hypothetical protein